MEDLISKGDTKKLKKYLVKDKKKKWIKETFVNGQNAVHVASDYGSFEVLQMLLKYNGNPNSIDNLNQNSLHIACKQGYLEIISLLVSKNADVSAVNFQGNTPLHFLIGIKPTQENITKFYATLEELKSAGADLNARNEQGETPLNLACLKRSEKNAMWLIRKGVDVNISNKKGETALHQAARFGSGNLVSILLSAGADATRQGTIGSPLDFAKNARRGSIIQLLEQIHVPLRTTSQGNVLVINGKRITKERLNKIKQRQYLTSSAPTPDTPRKILRSTSSKLRSSSNKIHIRRKSTVVELPEDDEMAKFHLAKSMLDINATLIDEPLQQDQEYELPQELDKEDNKIAWKGVLQLPQSFEKPSDNMDDWELYYAELDTKYFKIFETFPRKCIKTINLHSNISFQVYVAHPNRFSIVYYGNISDTLETYATKKQIEFLSLLKKLVECSGRPIEYIDGKPLLSVFKRKSKQANCSDIISLKSLSSPQKPSKKILSPRNSCNGLNVANDKQSHKQGIVHSSGSCLTVNFSSFLYESLFSDRICMKGDLYENKTWYILQSGTIGDIILYCMLIAPPTIFVESTDTEAFYLSYFRHISPKDVLKKIEESYACCASVTFPQPFAQHKPSTRLFYFLSGFIQSTFVLAEPDAELQFRFDLAELYGKLVSEPSDPLETVEKLRSSAQKVKRAREQASISQLCDLTSILGSKISTTQTQEGETMKEFSFDLSAFDVDDFVSQIICINADLYGQLQVAELVDLRFQKDKKFSVSVTKLQNFSNKIYLLVPTTILAPKDISQQKATLKKWVLIAEKLFKLRDYNSAIQISNGITEISVMRLAHLKQCLSLKWIERFERIRTAFDPISSFANYRNLPKDPPCIPFIGVSLKDLVFTYEGNQDSIDGGINFHKMRIIHDIVKSLKLEEKEQIDYSFLKFDPQIATALLNASPLDQDELYEKSVKISDSLKEILVSPASPDVTKASSNDNNDTLIE